MNKSRLNRISFRFELMGFTLFFMVAKTQTIIGMSSKIRHNRHIVLWDLDKCNLSEAIRTLTEVQFKYHLSDIAIYGDRNNGFCAICYKVVDFITMLRILIDTDYIDEGFLSYTAKRNKATLRLSRKEGRDEMKIKSVLRSYHISAPLQVERIIYKTGILKPEEGLRIGNIR